METAEESAPRYHRRPTYPVSCRVALDGRPVPQAYVVFEAVKNKEPGAPRADGFTAANGTLTLSTYAANDGVPAGEYVVTVEWRKPLYDEAGKPGPNELPGLYGKRDSTPLRARRPANLDCDEPVLGAHALLPGTAIRCQARCANKARVSTPRRKVSEGTRTLHRLARR